MYLSTPSSEIRSRPSCRLVNQRQQSERLDADHIPSYDALRASIVKHTSGSIFVNIKLYNDQVMLYIITWIMQKILIGVFVFLQP